MARDLPIAGDTRLGQPTVMDRGLAAKYGTRYVHLTAFAIDVDRLRAHIEEEADPESLWPFGWEVFLTEMYMLAVLDPAAREDYGLIEDVCVHIFELGPQQQALGAQIPFAVFDAVNRGAWPDSLLPLFVDWDRSANNLVQDLKPLWEHAEDEAADLADACLRAPMQPPFAPPTKHALATWLEVG